jgi:O-antigen/teichoic acid export membrane protein
MSLLRSLSLMGLTNVARLGAAVATFSITARVLGLVPYGQLMYWMSVAVILALLSNFGLAILLLKEIGQRPAEAVAILCETLAAKLIIVGMVVVGSLASLPFIASGMRGVFIGLLVAMLAEGFTEFFNAGFRARARFGVETRIAMVSAWVYPASVGIVAWATGSLLAISMAYMASRLWIAWLTWRQLRIVVGEIRPASLAVGWRRMRASISYAFDAGLGGLFGQLDSVILNHYLGHAAVGLYQAGMRVFLAGMGFGSVLANVFLPRAAAAHSGSADAFADENSKLQMTFLAVGGAFGLVLAIGGKWFAPLLFGQSFLAVVPLMPWFGLLFTIRFASVGWSISLTAQGLQWYRAQAAAVHWLVVLAVAAFSVPMLGTVGWLLALIIGNTLLLIAYVAKASKRSARDLRTLGLTTVCLCLFVPMLRFR